MFGTPAMLRRRSIGKLSMAGRCWSGISIGTGLSGIVNDPNGWFGDEWDLVAAIDRIVYVRVESTRIIEGLPREVPCGSGT